MENIKIKKISNSEAIKVFIESKKVENITECIKNLEIEATPIGEGGNAIIYVAENTPFSGVCLKKIKQKPQMIYNDIDQENKYQIMVHEAGVNTPLTLISIKTTEGEEYLIMEKIEGHTVGEISRNIDLLPENFDADTFCKLLDEQISKMHNAGIYHRDLHFDNVMIDKDCNPVIIDFGTATEGTGSDYTYEESVSVYNSQKGHYEYANGVFKDDDIMLKNIKSNVKGFIRR